jgi:transposase
MSKEEIEVKVKSLGRKYGISFRKMVVKEFEKGLLNKDELKRKYNISGNSRVLVWCRKYGKLHYPAKGNAGRHMKDPQKQRIKELERQLEDEKLKVIAYQKMIEITEREEGISILKKGEVKQSKSLGKDTHGK